LDIPSSGYFSICFTIETNSLIEYGYFIISLLTNILKSSKLLLNFSKIDFGIDGPYSIFFIYMKNLLKVEFHFHLLDYLYNDMKKDLHIL
jgi:hypothetical protein